MDRYRIKVTPIRRGVYVPGGQPISIHVIMNVVPAQVAGVEQIVLASRQIQRAKCKMRYWQLQELVAEIYRMGGAQAIAALAYGTEDMDPVDRLLAWGMFM